VIYFNGFSLAGEEDYFSEYLVESDYTVAGFSYGAQQAFDYVYQSKKRIDRLLLFSPAFFHDSTPAYIRTQLRYFASDREAYVSQFLKNVAAPSKTDLSDYVIPGSQEELEALLTYTWEREKTEEVLARGTVIEVFLGAQDKIIDAECAYTFFSALVTTYYLKDAGHLLR